MVSRLRICLVPVGLSLTRRRRPPLSSWMARLKTDVACPFSQAEASSKEFMAARPARDLQCNAGSVILGPASEEKRTFSQVEASSKEFIATRPTPMLASDASPRATSACLICCAT